MPTVLVVEDDAEVSLLLRELLEHHGYEVLDASTGAEAVALARRGEPDLVMVDLGLPDMTGIEVIRDLRAWSTVPILVLSGTSRRGSRADALDAGADDFVPKPFDSRELAARLRSAMRRAAADQGGHELRRGFGLVVVDVAAQRLLVGGAERRLTALEWRLLEALTRHPGRLLTHRWLVAQIWGPSHGPETQSSLRTHVRSLRATLGDDVRKPSYLRTESGIGYRWIAQATPAEASTQSPTGSGALADLQVALAALQETIATAAPTGDARDATLVEASELVRRAASLVRDTSRPDARSEVP